MVSARPASSRSVQRRGSYAGRRAVLATMHRKELAVAPAFHDVLGIDIVCPANIDTDALGTFTGEVERASDMLATVRRKAHVGLEATGASLAIASEGAYGPHPVYHFLPSGMEMMIFIDVATGIEVVETVEVSATNFGITTTANEGVDDTFLERIGFPWHGLVVESNIRASDEHAIIKGVTRRRDLERAIADMSRRSDDGLAKVHADLRAHVNPTRMREIGRVAKKLAERLACHCPACDTPGFGVADREPGLPCELCSQPTRIIALDVHACIACDYQQRQPRSDGQTAADPRFCDFCNP